MTVFLSITTSTAMDSGYKAIVSILLWTATATASFTATATNR